MQASTLQDALGLHGVFYRVAGPQAKATPVDLSAYARTQQEDRVAVAGGSRIVVTRRAPIELPAAARAEVNGAAPANPESEDDDSSLFDVPAFLRRQEG